MKKEIENYYKLVEIVVDKFLKRNRYYYKYREDLIGEGTLGLIHSLKTYDSEKSPAKTAYLSRGIRNYISNYIRYISKDLSHTLYINNISSLNIPIEEEENDVEYSWEIYDRLLPSDPIDREIYERVIAGSTTSKELANELNLLPNVVRQRKARLLKKLREILEDMNED